MVNTRSIARLGTLAVGLGIGAAWAHTPVASADTSTDWLSSVDSLVSGASPALVAPAVTDFQISFNGTDLFPTLGNEATATTVAGQFGLAIAFGNGASATAEGGTGNYALADGTNALANAGSLTSGATGNNYNIAEDIGNNTAGGAGAHDGAYAGAGSLIGATSSTGTDSNNSAYDFGNNGPDGALGGNSGVFAGDGQLIGEGGAGNGDTAYTAGNLSGNNDGSAAVAGNNDFASSSGAETGTNEGAFAALGNNNTAIADATYTISGDGVRATDGNGNYAYVFGPDNSTAAASGGNDIAYVSDPFSGATGPADSAVAGGGSFTNDLAEVLLAHGNATADTANLLYDIVSLFGNFSGTL